MPAKHVLFISRQRIVGATNGSSTYLLDLAAAVRRAGMVPHLVQPSPEVAGRWPVLSMRPEMAVFASHRIRGLLRLGRHYLVLDPRVYCAIAMAGLRGLARKLGMRGAWVRDRPMPYAVAGRWSDADHAWLRIAAAKVRPDVAIADYMFCTEGFADVPGVPTAIVMHDLFHVRAGGSADSVALVDRDAEVAMLARADAVLAIQAAEADFLVREVPGVEAILTPMAAQPVAAAIPGEEGRLLFVGSNTAPNVVGLEWFCEEVWPLVRAARPGVVLDVAGTVARGLSAGERPGVRPLGLVDDLAPLYARASVVISPLTFGSGLKIKLVEAMASGKAVVATPITVEGVEAICSGAVRVAAEAGHFADAIIALDADREARRALGEAARCAVAEHFGAERCHAGFAAWLARCGPPAQNAAVAENNTVDPAIEEPFLVEEKLGSR
ncbi:glycosyl transferase family 1 [Novosphingobium sp. PhB165]|uniref:glycosyltransferase n=1 Tax=Novosphingobium sp. PhB165 TaxID=2485105 RepID=UPI0010438CDA|nr:glycosyltransferase family 4 protein [Novosphingobium sp. PhB165]TCM18003.1 glycosyl transferase family 1 [Novosphingobium sp. PhB165]